MIKADKYFLETIKEIKENGFDSVNPRTKWADGMEAHYKYILPKVFAYDISKGEFPINTLRPTAIKGAFHDIAAIYQKQTNIIEDMDPSIHSWWTDFVTSSTMSEDSDGIRSIGQTYGDTVLRYDLMNRLLEQIHRDPFGRRNLLDLWQVQQMIDDPKALVPCCFLTMYTVTEEFLQKDKSVFVQNPNNVVRYVTKKRKLHLTMVQRSQDYIMTSCINPLQYTMLGMMICSHLNYIAPPTSDYYYEMGTMTHFVQNPHIYDRHFPAVEELLQRSGSDQQATLSLLPIKQTGTILCKNFYDIEWSDFAVNNYQKPKDLSYRLPIAI